MQAYVVLFHVFVLLGIVATGCKRAEPPPAPAKEAAQASEHMLTGEVITVTPGRSAVLVHHEAIPGYMPAMTMEFIVTPADLARLKEGQKLHGRIKTNGKGEILLEGIELIDPVKERTIEAAASQLSSRTKSNFGSCIRP